jgi:hypothetical protein
VVYPRSAVACLTSSLEPAMYAFAGAAHELGSQLDETSVPLIISATYGIDLVPPLVRFSHGPVATELQQL